jgi:hypothetical protein
METKISIPKNLVENTGLASIKLTAKGMTYLQRLINELNPYQYCCPGDVCCTYCEGC